MFKKTLFIVTGSLVAMSAFSADMANVKKSIPLEDGSTVYVFKDGKMGMEDRLGNAVSMKEGQAMEARNGQPVTMVGNEIARTHDALTAQWSK